MSPLVTVYATCTCILIDKLYIDAYSNTKKIIPFEIQSYNC